MVFCDFIFNKHCDNVYLTRPIMDLYEWYVQITGAWVYQRWWEQYGVDLEGARDRAAATSDGEEDKCGEEAAQE